MDNQNNPINPASPNLDNNGAAQPAAPVVPNSANGNTQIGAAAPAPGTPVDNLVQDIMPASKPVEAPAQPTPAAQPTVNEQPAQPLMNSQPAQPVQAQAPVNSNNTNPAPVAQPYGAPKKSHAGLIVGIVVLLLLVIGGIGGFLFYQQHEKTERVVADGLIKLLTAKELSADTSFTVKNNNELVDDTDIESAKFTISTSKNTKLESSANATIEIKMHEYDALKVQAEAMEGENAIYFRIIDTGNLSTFIGKLAEEEGEGENINVKSIFESMFTSIGDSWYEIPYDKIDGTGKVKQTLDCVREKTANITEGENWNKIMDLYKENSFISVAKDAKIEKVDGYKKYPLTIDEDKADTFMDKLEEEDFMEEVNSCADDAYDDDDSSASTKEQIMGGLDSSDEYDEYEEYDFDDEYSYSETLIEPEIEKEEDKESYNITLGIKPWSHELVWVGFDYKMDSASEYGDHFEINGEANISYESKVATPGNTKSIDEFVEIVQKSIEDSSKQIYYETYCTEEENFAGYKDAAECKAAVDEAFGENASSGDLDDLLDEFRYMI